MRHYPPRRRKLRLLIITTARWDCEKLDTLIITAARWDGENLHTLVITTARQDDDHPLAGAVFAAFPEIPGRTLWRFDQN